MAFEMLKWRGSWTGILGFFSPTPTVLLHRKAPGQSSGGDLAWVKLGGSTCVAPDLSYGYELKETSRRSQRARASAHARLDFSGAQYRRPSPSS